jgi:hypothetical protein
MAICFSERWCVQRLNQVDENTMAEIAGLGGIFLHSSVIAL